MEDFWGNVSPSEHVLQLYEDHEEFFNVLAGYVSAGLRSGDAVVIIATPDHLAGLEERLRQQGFDLFTLGLRDQYIPLDAEETLSQFVIDDWPDLNLCHYLLTNLLLRARKGNRKVRMYGEMVALLLERGLTDATLFLEEWWGRQAHEEGFSIFCAYPRHGFSTTSVECLARVCTCHSRLVTAADEADELLVNEVAFPPVAH